MGAADKRYDAIIFDLFGTLVDNIITAQDYACLTETARVVGVAPEAFIAGWTEPHFRAQRRIGVYPTSAAEIEQVCRNQGVAVTPAQVADAVEQLRAWYGLPALIPRERVLETLALLKEQGYALGLISDCSWAVPDVWEQSAFAGLFDATIFSCEAGAKKPDPRLYQLACDRLHVLPQRCLYIGDGHGQELAGARQAGMEAILLCAPYERDFIIQREDVRQWDGPVIEHAAAVWPFLETAAGITWR